MKVDVTKERVAITQCHVVTEGEYCVNECEFQLPECFNGLTVTAVFNDIPVPLLNNKCFIPSLKKGGAVLGVYAYRKNGDALELVYSPKPTAFYVDEGSYTGATEIEETPEISRYEEYCAMLSQLCENLISQIDYIEKSSLAQDVSDQSTHSQIPTARAVYENSEAIKRDVNEDILLLKENQISFMGSVSNALQGEISGEKIIIEDISSLPHKIACSFERKNLSSVSTTGEFNQIKQVTFNNVLPSGTYSFSAVVESSDTDSDVCLFSFTLNGVSKKAMTMKRSANGERISINNISMPSEFDGIIFYASVSNVASVGDTAIIKDIQLEKGEFATEYVPYTDLTGTDVILSGKNLCHITAFECVPSAENDVSHKTVNLKTTLPAGQYSFSARVTSNNANIDKFLMLLLNKKDDGTTDEVGYYYFTKGDKERFSIENQNIPKPFNCINFYSASDAMASISNTAFFNEFQIEIGSLATEYEEFKDINVLSINEDCEISSFESVYPTTAVIPTHNGIITKAIYNRDINKVISKLEKAVT